MDTPATASTTLFWPAHDSFVDINKSLNELLMLSSLGETKKEYFVDKWRCTNDENLGASISRSYPTGAPCTTFERPVPLLSLRRATYSRAARRPSPYPNFSRIETSSSPSSLCCSPLTLCTHYFHHYGTNRSNPGSPVKVNGSPLRNKETKPLLTRSKSLDDLNNVLCSRLPCEAALQPDVEGVSYKISNLHVS